MLKFKIFAAFLTGIILCGCADPVVFSEVFQPKKGQRFYTNYNLWFTDPLKMDSLNIQQGSIIPAGTEIIPEETGRWSDKITFRSIATGKTHSIKFSSAERLCTMREFISYTFTTTPPEELFKDLPDNVKARVIRGEVVPGMSSKAVMLSFGPPPACRTPSLKNDTWIYWRNPEDVIRVVFRDDKVRTILNAGQNR